MTLLGSLHLSFLIFQKLLVLALVIELVQLMGADGARNLERELLVLLKR